jgi:hypothetical protein
MGHWLIGLAFGAPALVIPVALVLMGIRDRRREQAEVGAR